MIDWNGKRVLVAGGAGQIGSHLAKRLVGLGAYVTVADNLITGVRKNIQELINIADMEELFHEHFRFEHHDLRKQEDCGVAVIYKDYVFQLAANMGGMIFIADEMGHSAELTRDNLLINVNMLEAARLAGIKRYFFSSSACVYPNYLQEKVDASSINLKESDVMPADPNEVYGWEKLMTEKLCEAYQHDYGMDIRIARFHNVFGECFTSFDKDRGKAPCLMIANVLKYNGGLFDGIWGDGRQVRSFLYAEDCVDGILALMDSDYDNPINIGSDECISIGELALLVAKIAGKKFEGISYQYGKPIGVMGRNADLTLAKKVLNWYPKYSLEEGLRKTYEWAKERQNELINL